MIPHGLPCVLITADSLLRARGFSSGCDRYSCTFQLEVFTGGSPGGKRTRQCSAHLTASGHINKYKINSQARREAEVADVIFMIAVVVWRKHRRLYSFSSLPQKILPSHVHFIQSGSHFLTLPGICQKVRLKPKKYWGFFFRAILRGLSILSCHPDAYWNIPTFLKKKDLPSGLSLSLELLPFMHMLCLPSLFHMFCTTKILCFSFALYPPQAKCIS